MTIIQAISISGGFAEWADTKKIIIVRRENDREVQLRFNYQQYLSGKNLAINILLKQNDTVIVP